MSMKRILFVCHGNICRSPMAEYVMKSLVEEAGLSDDLYIESAATSTEEIGNSVYPPARRKLAEHGIACNGKTARQMTRSDYLRFDLLIGMDSYNIRNMERICGGDPEGKIHLLMDFTLKLTTWQTLGTQATSRPPGRTCCRVANACYANCDSPQFTQDKKYRSFKYCAWRTHTRNTVDCRSRILSVTGYGVPEDHPCASSEPKRLHLRQFALPCDLHALSAPDFSNGWRPAWWRNR